MPTCAQNCMGWARPKANPSLASLRVDANSSMRSAHARTRRSEPCSPRSCRSGSASRSTRRTGPRSPPAPPASPPVPSLSYAPLPFERPRSRPASDSCVRAPRCLGGRQCTTELERLRELKRVHTATFIEGCRKDIRMLWEALFIGETEQAEFQAMTDRTCAHAHPIPTVSSHHRVPPVRSYMSTPHASAPQRMPRRPCWRRTSKSSPACGSSTWPWSPCSR